MSIRLKQLNRVSLVRRDDDWALRVPFESPTSLAAQRPLVRALHLSRWSAGIEVTTLITGDAALRAAGMLLPAINVQGAKRDEVDAAVHLIERSRRSRRVCSRGTRAQGDGRQRRSADADHR